jgi:TolA-binding protein
MGITQHRNGVANVKAIMRLGKHHATYWIALTHAESENYDVAVEWFRDLILAGEPESPWHQGARYNLARCYEAQGKWEEARQTHLSDDSPQRHGNLLRAAAIAREHGAGEP